MSAGFYDEVGFERGGGNRAILLPGETVTVYQDSPPGTQSVSLQSLFSNELLTVPLANPFTADALGNLVFWADATWVWVKVGTRAARRVRINQVGATGATGPTGAAGTAAATVYTKAGLPAGTHGDIAEVSNELRGLWHRAASQWVKVNPTVSVQDFGAVCNGVADDTAAVQAAIDAVATAGGGGIAFPAGICLTGQLTMKSRVTIQGAGVDVTILKLKNGTNATLLKSLDWDTLVGSLKETPELRGTNYIGLRDITLDGNKANNTSGWVLQIWGRNHRWANVRVQNGKSGGIWTEYTTIDSPGALPDDSTVLIDPLFYNIECVLNDGDSWDYRGPHDATIYRYICWGHKGWALKNSSSSGRWDGAIHCGYDWNVFLDDAVPGSPGGVQFGSGCQLSHCSIGSSHFNGTCIDILAGVGSCLMNDMNLGTGTVGLMLRGSGHTFSGYIHQIQGDAIKVEVASMCKVIAFGDTCDNVLNIVSETGTNDMDLKFFVAADKTLRTGATPGSRDNMVLRAIGISGGVSSAQTWTDALLPMQFPTDIWHTDKTGNLRQYWGANGTTFSNAGKNTGVLHEFRDLAQAAHLQISPPADGELALLVRRNVAGVFSVVRVLEGAQGTGPIGGTSRALYVAT